MKKQNKVLKSITEFFYTDIGPVFFWGVTIFFIGALFYTFETGDYGQGKFIFAHYNVSVRFIMMYMLMFVNSRLWFLVSKRRYCLASFLLILISNFGWCVVDILEKRIFLYELTLFIATLGGQIIGYWFFAKLPEVVAKDKKNEELDEWDKEFEEQNFEYLLFKRPFDFDFEEYDKLNEVYHFSLPENEVKNLRKIHKEIQQRDSAFAIEMRYVIDQLCSYTAEQWADQETYNYWKDKLAYYEQKSKVLLQFRYCRDCCFIYIYAAYLCEEIPQEINVFSKDTATTLLRNKNFKGILGLNDVMSFLVAELEQKNMPLEKKASILQEIYEEGTNQEKPMEEHRRDDDGEETSS